MDEKVPFVKLKHTHGSSVKALTWRTIPFKSAYSFSHNHGSVENGCIWKATTIGGGGIFHWTMIVGGKK